MVNLAEEILRNADTRPEHIAMWSGGNSLSYRELREEVFRTRAVLTGLGAGEGSVLGFGMRDTRQVTIAMLAAWHMGATCNLLDFRLKDEDLQAAVKMFKHTLIVTDRPANLPDGIGMIAQDWTARLAASAPTPAPAANPRAPAMAAVTSGTTGTPAGFETTHEALFARSNSWEGSRISEAYEHYLCMSPIAFGATFGWITNVLRAGGTITCFPPVARPSDVFDVVARQGITGTMMVPTVLRDLIAHARQTGRRLRNERGPIWLVTTGAAITEQELRDVHDLLSPRIIQIYAASPVGPICTMFTEEMDERMKTVGTPARGVIVEIVDENGRAQPQGTIGRIRVLTPGRATNMRGRDGNSGGDHFDGDWYYPGDLGVFDGSGYLTLAGRATEVIIRGGVNVYPQEIEATVLTFAGVREAAAVGFPDKRAGEEIAVFAVTEDGITAESLLAQCRTAFPADKRPSRAVIVSSMPLNANGKIVRGRLRRQLMEARADAK
ncbi:class I adenylate-forming enzyme family protein [Algicella marina]|uniref:AMP-binding protein n=1 Tax=Algicella marina TaxID=2683284 RepID=A0A6P1T2P2_9RHOB|nr:class I adenylate-forming enzyme family protein [Algicella marina]QHQ36060.1 AMP-binding protein [Algicella marina]